MKEQIDKQMMQYAVCGEDLNEIEQDLHNADYNDEEFDTMETKHEMLNCKMKLRVLKIYILILEKTMTYLMILAFHQHH